VIDIRGKFDVRRNNILPGAPADAIGDQIYSLHRIADEGNLFRARIEERCHFLAPCHRPLCHQGDVKATVLRHTRYQLLDRRNGRLRQWRHYTVAQKQRATCRHRECHTKRGE
jgi:hypothetical protein